ncbi:MAG TPA: carotenoid oxygenase family protein [Burkholderiaceae bacterium]|nr:carotenoid oxygenase family protein [Burkholderiaceae bacterium]
MDVPGRARGFLSGAREIDDAAVAVQGAVPSWLRGTLLLNGPALWELPHGRLRHWFDGYAMWHALRIGDGHVRYRSRFAQSESYRRSVAAGRPVYGEFGSPNPAGFWTRLRAPQITDNPSVVMAPHGRRWLSVTETPHLTYFDPVTLATEERVDLVGRGAQTLHLMAAHGFTLADGSYLNVGAELGPRCTMKLFRLAPGARAPEVIACIPVPATGYLHAFALAPGHALIWETALRARPLAFRFGAKSYADNFSWRPASGSAIHAVPLGGGAVRCWRIPPMYGFHATQSWADGSDLVLEMVIYDDATIFFDELTLERRRAGAPMRSVARHVRYRLRQGRGDAEPEAIGDTPIELQSVHPARVGRARARVCWGASNGEDGTLNARTVRVDLDSGASTVWQRPRATQLEPLFVPRPGGTADDDGVLLVNTLADEDETSVIAVLDARHMGCLAELHAPQIVPFGFHSAFVPAA